MKFVTTGSVPIRSSILFSLDAFLSGFPVLVAEGVSDGVDFGPGTEEASVVAFGFEVSNGDDHEASCEDHPLPDFFVRSSPSCSSLDEGDEVRDVVGHLGGGGWGSVFVLDESVIELPGHSDDHVVEVGVEVLALGDVHSIWGFEVVASEDVVDVVAASWSHSDFEEVGGPDSSVGVLGLILTEVGWVHFVVDVSVSFVPLLVVILFEVLMGWVDGEVLAHPSGELQLLVDLVEEDIVFLGDHSVAVTTVPAENLET